MSIPSFLGYFSTVTSGFPVSFHVASNCPKTGRWSEHCSVGTWGIARGRHHGCFDAKKVGYDWIIWEYPIVPTHFRKPPNGNDDDDDADAAAAAGGGGGD